MSKPKPNIVTARVAAPGADALRTTPSLLYSVEAADRAISRIGQDAYTILRTKAIFGVWRQQASLRTHLDPLVAALRAQEEAPEADRTRAGLEANSIGQDIHWQGIVRLGTAIEGLVSTISALEMFRDGSGDPADCLLRHDLDLLRVLQERKRRRPGYWEALSNREVIVAAAMDPEDTRQLLAANRKWSFGAMTMFGRLQAYYTAPMHAVYAKYKHGYTLVSPTTSPLFLEAGETSRRAELLFRAGGFAVMNQDRVGNRVVYVLETGDTPVELTLTAARDALALTGELATMWLLEVEHPDQHGLAFDGLSPELLARWFGSGLDDAYSLSDLLTVAEAAAPPGAAEELHLGET